MMTPRMMWTAARYTANPIRQLAPQEIEMLAEWFCGRHGGYDANALAKFLWDLRARKEWLACGCTQTEGKFPMLFPSKIGNTSQVTLKRREEVEVRPMHEPSCVFAFQYDRDGQSARQERKLQRCVADEDAFVAPLLDEEDGAAPQSEDDCVSERSGPGSGVRRDSSVGLTLWIMMRKAGLETIERPMNSQTVSRLDHNGMRLVKASGGIAIPTGASLESILTRWDQDIRVPGSPWQARIAGIQGWPAGKARTGYAITWSKDIKRNAIQAAGLGPIEFRAPITRPSFGKREIAGPWLVLGMYRITPQGAVPEKAYAQPIHSFDMPVAVDSQYERTVMNGLMDGRDEYEEDVTSCIVTMTKPVIAIDYGRGFCRPDFIVRIDDVRRGTSISFVVEAMGFDSGSYSVRKDRTHEAMSAIGPVETLQYSPSTTAAEVASDFIQMLRRNHGRI